MSEKATTEEKEPQAGKEKGQVAMFFMEEEPKTYCAAHNEMDRCGAAVKK